MDGSTSLVFRDVNGEVHKGTAWTNPLKGFVHNPRFLEKNRAWMFGRYGLMGQVLRNQAAGKWPSGNTQLAPYVYGLTVIDWQHDKILHLSDYNSLDTWKWGHEVNYRQWGWLAHLFRSGVYTLPIELGVFAESLGGKDGPAIDLYARNLAEQLRTLFTAAYEAENSRRPEFAYLRPFTFEGIQADLYPFAYRDYSGRGGSSFSVGRRITQMLADIQALGFELTPAELQAWGDWIAVEAAEQAGG